MQKYEQEQKQQHGFSQWRNVRASKPDGVLTLYDWCQSIADGKYRQAVENLRGIEDDKEQKERKKDVLCVTPSARAEGARRETEPHWQCNLICIDIDKKEGTNDNKTADELWALAVEQYHRDPELLAMHRSTRGVGLALYYRYPTTADELCKAANERAFDILQEKWRAMGVELDSACTEVVRARLFSYDPEALYDKAKGAELVWRYFPDGQHPKAKTPQPQPEPVPIGTGDAASDLQNDFPEARSRYTQNKERAERVWTQATRPPSTGGASLMQDDLFAIAEHVRRSKIDVTTVLAASIGCSKYEAYTKLAFACADAGDEGLLHELCRWGRKYDAKKVSDKFAECTRNRRGSVTVKSVFWIAKQIGIPTRSAMTRDVLKQFAQHIRKAGQAGGARTKGDAVVSVLEGIADTYPKTSDAQLQKYANWAKELTDSREALNQIEGDKFTIAHLQKWMQDFPIEYNAVLDRAEIDGRLLTDRHLADLWLSAKKTLSDTVKREDISSIIASHSTPTYDPFLRYLEGIEGTQSDGGQLDRLLGCLTFTEPQHGEFYRTLVVKWLLSIVASMRGDYSVICLVLVGRQGVGKTTFFRGVLPDELRAYYAESKLDGEKDSLELLASKLIICDDEFSGKSKKDARRFKELISKDVITVRAPYARYSSDRRRVAVWCGSSNSEGVLVDQTGNRRIIPVGLAALDFASFASIDRDKLWRELDDMYQADPLRFHLTRDEVEALAVVSKGKYEATVREREAIEEFLEVPEDEEEAVVMTSTKIAQYIEGRGKYTASVYVVGDVMRSAGFQFVRAKRDYPEHGTKRTQRGWLVKFCPVMTEQQQNSSYDGEGSNSL